MGLKDDYLLAKSFLDISTSDETGSDGEALRLFPDDLRMGISESKSGSKRSTFLHFIVFLQLIARIARHSL